jgi:hypothetical protein
MNYARRSLLRGEKVIHTILQPEIRASVITLLGLTFYRTISPTLVSILTDRELILIQETERITRAEKYGGAWTYVPLNKITSLSIGEKANDLLVLSIQLPEDTRLECLFQASMRQEVNQLVEKFRKLAAAH